MNFLSIYVPVGSTDDVIGQDLVAATAAEITLPGKFTNFLLVADASNTAPVYWRINSPGVSTNPAAPVSGVSAGSRFLEPGMAYIITIDPRMISYKMRLLCAANGKFKLMGFDSANPHGVML